MFQHQTQDDAFVFSSEADFLLCGDKLHFISDAMAPMGDPLISCHSHDGVVPCKAD